MSRTWGLIIHNQETEETYELLESCGRMAGLFFAQHKDCLPAVGIVWFSEGRQAKWSPLRCICHADAKIMPRASWTSTGP